MARTDEDTVRLKSLIRRIVQEELQTRERKAKVEDARQPKENVKT